MIKARIVKERHGLYHGEIYNDKVGKWKQITDSCYTKWGARRLIYKYIKDEIIEEIEV